MISIRTQTAFLAALTLAATVVHASKDSIVTAVYSTVSNGYKRQYDAKGDPKPEYYAIANGKYMPGATKDPSIDDVKFPTVAGTVAQVLAKRNYLPAKDTRSADLLLMITWGTTIPYDDGNYRKRVEDFASSSNLRDSTAAAAKDTPTTRDGIQSPEAYVAQAARDQFEGDLIMMRSAEDMRRRADERNARLLGYINEINQKDNPSRFGGAGSVFDDLISDIEHERYYVIVAAYDFRALTKNPKPKLLWITRVSIQRAGNRFDDDLATMVSQASRFFGENSDRLIREYHEGRVTLGNVQFVGVTPETPKDKN